MLRSQFTSSDHLVTFSQHLTSHENNSSVTWYTKLRYLFSQSWYSLTSSPPPSPMMLWKVFTLLFSNCIKKFTWSAMNHSAHCYQNFCPFLPMLACLHLCWRVCVCRCVHALCVCVCVCVHACMFTWVWMHVYEHAHVCVCACELR